MGSNYLESTRLGLIPKVLQTLKEKIYLLNCYLDQLQAEKVNVLFFMKMLQLNVFTVYQFLPFKTVNITAVGKK